MKIGSLNNAEAVRAQYSSSDGLNTRISFHSKYSTNKYGYGNWILSNYEIGIGAKVLELGCGTASIWIEQDDLINKCELLIFTDLSEAMLQSAKDNIGERDNVRFAKADIQNIPFEDDSFDVVIANAMLYHVPDIEAGIHEVRRVLKDTGAFYCSTYGEHNFTDVLAKWFELDGETFNPNHNFTLQNGAKKLEVVFSDVEALFYEDSLHIGNVEDIVEYLRSLTSFKAIYDYPASRIREVLLRHANNGVIELPKEYGMFVCKC